MASTASPQPTISWFVEIFTNNPPPENAHLTSVILMSEGAENLGALSTAVSRPCPYVLDREANGAIAAAIAVLDKNDLLEVDIIVVLLFVKFIFLSSLVHCIYQSFDAS
jgi:hypothetical protein